MSDGVSAMTLKVFSQGHCPYDYATRPGFAWFDGIWHHVNGLVIHQSAIIGRYDTVTTFKINGEYQQGLEPPIADVIYLPIEPRVGAGLSVEFELSDIRKAYSNE